MKQAYVFPGQGSQFPGMGKDMYQNNAFAKKLFEQANELLGFRISDVMFNGDEKSLRQTNVTQPAVFIHSVIAYKGIENVRPEAILRLPLTMHSDPPKTEGRRELGCSGRGVYRPP